MKWECVANLRWQAKGKHGDFLIWKEGKRWKGRYLSADKTNNFFLPWKKSLKEMKTICEDNYYWE